MRRSQRGKAHRTPRGGKLKCVPQKAEAKPAIRENQPVAEARAALGETAFWRDARFNDGFRETQGLAGGLQ